MKVCVLAAGQGSRMGEACTNNNKVLLPLDKMAIISHIIKRFPDDAEFVVAVGHQSAKVKSYLQMAHPSAKISFVDVSPYGGPDSGPGLSALSCKGKLREPFFLICGDSLWDEDILDASGTNWIGVSEIPSAETHTYCVLEGDEYVTRIYDKESLHSKMSYKAFNGILHIQNPADFFDGLTLTSKVQGEFQLSEGIRNLCKNKSVRMKTIKSWVDVGTEEKYRNEFQKHENMTKRGEVFYKVDDKIIKHFDEPDIALNRVKRAELFPAIFPRIIDSENGFYSYGFIPGQNLYEAAQPQLFTRFLTWMKDHVWKISVDPYGFSELCLKFYRDKTIKRLGELFKRHPSLQNEGKTINGIPCRDVEDLLNLLNWKFLATGKPSVIHGDLQLGNIIFENQDEEVKFSLVDWRQDFAGDLLVGDLYYDFAKLYASLILDLNMVTKGKVHFNDDDRDVKFTFPAVSNFEFYERQLKNFIRAEGHDFNKVKLLSGIVILNMAALHLTPLDRFLFHLGRSLIERFLMENIENPVENAAV